MIDFPMSDAEVLAYVDGEDDLSEDSFDDLYSYYIDPARGPDMMPYGTAKARDGDPYNWIAHQLHIRAREIREQAAFQIAERLGVPLVAVRVSEQPLGDLVGQPMEPSPPSATFSNPIRYRGYRIYRSDYVPMAGTEFSFVHEDYDGAEDSNDNRHGYAANVEAAKAEIDEKIDD
jgi:hypothetical protein